MKIAVFLLAFIQCSVSHGSSWMAAPLQSVQNVYEHPGKLGRIVVRAAYNVKGIEYMQVEVSGKTIDVPAKAYSDLDYPHIDDIQVLYADKSEDVFYLTIYYGDWDVCEQPSGCPFSRIKYMNGKFVSREVSLPMKDNMVQFKNEAL